MNTRRAYVDLIYNGTAATAEISGFVTDISYTDPASGEADSLDITLQDRDRAGLGRGGRPVHDQERGAIGTNRL